MAKRILLASLLLAHGATASYLRQTSQESFLIEPESQKERRLVGELISGTGLERYWQVSAKFDSFKTSAQWSTTDRRTLTKMHYLVLPLWYSDEAKTAESYITPNQTVYAQTAEHYREMSFGKFTLSFSFLNQFQLSGVSRNNPTLQQVEDATRKYVTNTLGLVHYVDYDGIVVLHNRAFNGPLLGLGGWGTIDGNFVWMTSPASFGVLRHEIGHCLGHSHHYSNQEGYRNGALVEEGYDFMSGGNNNDIADLNAASKWWYNWIPDDAVVTMTPGGASSNCPSCLAEVSSLTLYPFDSRSVTPSASNKMAVHIPIAADGSNTPYLHGYWLSYRTGYTDSAKGLSMHMVWMQAVGGDFGMFQDAVMFDAQGATSSLQDSFLLPGTCYVMTPPSPLVDFDPIAAEVVQPVVCVDDLTEGEHITVSVRFLDPKSPPANKVALASTRELGCLSGAGVDTGVVSLNNSNGKLHLLHYTDMGVGGVVEFRLNAASDGSTTTAYFYDDYPYAYLALGAPIGYGAFHTVSSTTSASTVDYEGIYNDVYILIVMNNNASPGSTVSFRSTCTIIECQRGEYLANNGKCQLCPSGTVSPVGAVGLAECVSCGNGLHPIGLGSDKCYFSYETTNVQESMQWRIWTKPEWTSQGWFSAIDNLRFFTSTDCSAGTEIPVTTSKLFASSVYDDNWTMNRALPGQPGLWGGYADSTGYIYLGVNFGEQVTVGCIQFDQYADHYLLKAAVQAKAGTGFVNVAFFDNLSKGSGLKFSLPSSAPAPAPTPPSPQPAASTLTNSDYNKLAQSCLQSVKKACACLPLVKKNNATCFTKAIRSKCEPTLPAAASTTKVRNMTLMRLKKTCRKTLA